MAAADVLFTKPGGLTTTEAAVKGIPIVHTRPIPGCETKIWLLYRTGIVPDFPKTARTDSCRPKTDVKR